MLFAQREHLGAARQRRLGNVQPALSLPTENRHTSFASDIRGTTAARVTPNEPADAVAQARSLVFDALQSQCIPASGNWVFETRSCLHASAFIANAYNGELPRLFDALASLRAHLGTHLGKSIKLKDTMMVIGDTQTLAQTGHRRAIDAARRLVDTQSIAIDALSPDETIETVVDKRVQAITEGAVSHVELPDATPGKPMLLNCFLLEAPWLDAFSKAHTQRAFFHLQDGRRKVVDMMREPDGSYNVGQSVAGFDVVVEKPLGNDSRADRLRMIYALPSRATTPNHDAFHALLERLSAPGIPLKTLGLKTRSVDFRVPRFDLTVKTDVTPSTHLAQTDLAVSHHPASIQMQQVICVGHHEKGFRAAGTQRTVFMDGAGERIKITLGRPFYMLLTTKDGLPLLAMHIADPSPAQNDTVSASPTR